MAKSITQCLACESSELSIAKVCCKNCQASFEGQFHYPTLLKLSESELEFIANFVKCSGSLKDMAKILDISYPTLRNRLNDLIENLKQLEESRQSKKEKILTLLEQGKISAKQAAEQLKDL